MNPDVNQSDNRLSSSDGYVFDDAGNTTRDPQLRKFTYDAENKQVEVLDRGSWLQTGRPYGAGMREVIEQLPVFSFQLPVYFAV